MAGDVHKVQNADAMAPQMEMAYAKSSAAEPQFAEQAFAEYHL